jgi:hypothetical protein
MTLATPLVTLPGDAGLLIPRWTAFLAQNQARMAQVLGMPSVKGTVTTTTNDTGQIIDLTDQGFNFLASRFYSVRLKYWAETDNDRWQFERQYTVLGGTTPVILNTAPEITNALGVIVTTPVKYGRCRAQSTYAGDTATAVAANSSPGSTLGDNSTNTITLTHPIGKVSPKYVTGINASSDAITATEGLHVSAYVTGGTSTTILLYAMDLATPSADGFDDVGVLDVEFYVEPIVNCFLTMNSNNVEAHVLGITSDEVFHTVEVFVDEGLDVPFYGS